MGISAHKGSQNLLGLAVLHELQAAKEPNVAHIADARMLREKIIINQ